jgi:hypothetical protein
MQHIMYNLRSPLLRQSGGREQFCRIHCHLTPDTEHPVEE